MSQFMRIPGTVVLVLFGVGSQPPGIADGRIAVRVVETDGQLTPARAWVDAAGQRLFQPVAPDTTTPYAKDRSFSCDGSFTMVVPAGKAVVHVEKGKEFLPVDVAVQVSEGTTAEQTITIERWIDMPEAGWYSADLHVHLGYDNPQILRQLALADDVHLMPSFTYWLRGKGETWNAQWPSDAFAQPITVDSRHVVTRNNIEIERISAAAVPGAAIGATFLFNLQQPVTAARYGEYFPTDAELCRTVRQQSPAAVFDSDKPAWAETVVGAALGMLDTIQVCHNHYHRLSTLTGGFGMIGPLVPGESNAAVGDGLFHRTNALYYRFLNCGLRLGVSGGSAIGVMPLPAGHHRVYARVERPFTADSMWESIKAGRTFATTGPMLTLTADARDIGSTITVNSSGAVPVNIRTAVHSIETLEAIEIVHNGSIIASRDLRQMLPDPTVTANLEFKLTPTRSGWIASRALYRAPDGLLRQAHTSPIYISVDGKPTATAGDARYMLRWIDRLAEIAESYPDRFPDADAQNAVLRTYGEARSCYGQILEDAEAHWDH